MFLVTAPLSAHPHLFLEAQVQVNWPEDRPVSVTARWWMDQFFSASLIHDYDRNKNGRFDPEETRSLQAEAFSNLEKFGYFLFFRTGNKKSSPTAVREFKALQEKNLVVYEFTVDIPREFWTGGLNVGVFDTSFFTSISYRNPGLVGLPGEGNYAWEIVEDKARPVFYNPLDPPDSNQVYTRWRPGLVTAYPQEIRIFKKDSP